MAHYRGVGEGAVVYGGDYDADITDALLPPPDTTTPEDRDHEEWERLSLEVYEYLELDVRNQHDTASSHSGDSDLLLDDDPPPCTQSCGAPLSNEAASINFALQGTAILLVLFVVGWGLYFQLVSVSEWLHTALPPNLCVTVNTTPYFIPVPLAPLLPKPPVTTYTLQRYFVVTPNDAHLTPLELAASRLRGTPVLFLHGHGGTYRQARNFAHAAQVMHEDAEFQNLLPLDYFAADFNEEFSAFSGEILWRQTVFVRHCIEAILRLYRTNGSLNETGHLMPTAPNQYLPETVILLGYSMGGIMSRAVFALPDFNVSLVRSIITLGTPHTASVFPADRGVDTFYDVINAVWRANISDGARGLPPLNTTDLNTTWVPFPNLVIASLSGGRRDVQVRPELSDLHQLAPSSHHVSVVTTSVPALFGSIGHDGLTTCDRMMPVINRCIWDLVDSSRGLEWESPSQRMLVLSHHFKDPFVARVGAHTWVLNKNRATLPPPATCFDIAALLDTLVEDLGGLLVAANRTYWEHKPVPTSTHGSRPTRTLVTHMTTTTTPIPTTDSNSTSTDTANSTQPGGAYLGAFLAGLLDAPRNSSVWGGFNASWVVGNVSVANTTVGQAVWPGWPLGPLQINSTWLSGSVLGLSRSSLLRCAPVVGRLQLWNGTIHVSPFALWRATNGHPLPPDIDKFLLPGNASTHSTAHYMEPAANHTSTVAHLADLAANQTQADEDPEDTDKPNTTIGWKSAPIDRLPASQGSGVVAEERRILGAVFGQQQRDQDETMQDSDWPEYGPRRRREEDVGDLRLSDGLKGLSDLAGLGGDKSMGQDQRQQVRPDTAKVSKISLGRVQLDYETQCIRWNASTSAPLKDGLGTGTAYDPFGDTPGVFDQLRAARYSLEGVSHLALRQVDRGVYVLGVEEWRRISPPLDSFVMLTSLAPTEKIVWDETGAKAPDRGFRAFLWDPDNTGQLCDITSQSVLVPRYDKATPTRMQPQTVHTGDNYAWDPSFHRRVSDTFLTLAPKAMAGFDYVVIMTPCRDPDSHPDLCNSSYLFTQFFALDDVMLEVKPKTNPFPSNTITLLGGHALVTSFDVEGPVYPQLINMYSNATMQSPIQPTAYLLSIEKETGKFGEVAYLVIDTIVHLRPQKYNYRVITLMDPQAAFTVRISMDFAGTLAQAITVHGTYQALTIVLLGLLVVAWQLLCWHREGRYDRLLACVGPFPLGTGLVLYMLLLGADVGLKDAWTAPVFLVMPIFVMTFAALALLCALIQLGTMLLSGLFTFCRRLLACDFACCCFNRPITAYRQLKLAVERQRASHRWLGWVLGGLALLANVWLVTQRPYLLVAALSLQLWCACALRGQEEVNFRNYQESMVLLATLIIVVRLPQLAVSVQRPLFELVPLDLDVLLVVPVAGHLHLSRHHMMPRSTHPVTPLVTALASASMTILNMTRTYRIVYVLSPLCLCYVAYYVATDFPRVKLACQKKFGEDTDHIYYSGMLWWLLRNVFTWLYTVTL